MNSPRTTHRLSGLFGGTGVTHVKNANALRNPSPFSRVANAHGTQRLEALVGVVGIELLFNFIKSRVFTVLPAVNQMNWS